MVEYEKGDKGINMYQYFVNKKMYIDTRKPGEKFEFKEKCYSDTIFSGYRWDKEAKAENAVFNNCVFSNLGMKCCYFSHVNMSHSIFISCYIKAGQFRCCDFSGAVFIDCNFDETSFMDCEFQYAQFKGCYIPYEVMKTNLPRKRHNQNRDLCRNLGLEALHNGDDDNFRKYYFEEKRASEKYFFKKFYHSSDEDGGYYAKKYNIWDAISGFFHFILSKLNCILWGYGERLGRLITNMCLIVLIYWGIYQKMPIQRLDDSLRWYDGLYISLSNFFTISPVSKYTFPDTWGYEFASVSEAGIGVILVGFFVAAIFRYINRRS